MSSYSRCIPTRALAAALLLMVMSSSGNAQHAEPRYAPWPGDPSHSTELLRDLRALIERAERDRAASPAFLDDLRALADRHDGLPRRAVLSESFADGDYLRDPAWTVARGEFFIERGYGLRSIVNPPPDAAAAASDGGQPPGAEQILGAILQQVIESKTGGGTATPAKPVATDALIHTRLRAGNGFSIEMEFWTGNEKGTFEVGVFQGVTPGPGYRLSLLPGERPSLVLSRVGARGDAVIDTAIRQLRLEPGKLHSLQWTRGDQGSMTVTVDGQQLMRGSDRSFRDAWEGVFLRNGGGDFTVRRIVLRAAS